MAKMMKSSTLRCSFGSIHWSGLKLPSAPPRGTWQAILAAKSETSKVAMRRAPLSPSRRRRQLASTPQASGVTMPSPVTTTRLIGSSRASRPIPYFPDACARQGNVRFSATGSGSAENGGWSALCVFLEELDGVADRQDGLGGIIGNLAAEFLLERHDELHCVETVGTEIVDETGVLGHLLGFHAQMLHDDLFHPLANIAHRCNLVSFELGSFGRRRPRAITVWVVSGSSGRERTPPSMIRPVLPQPNRSPGYHTSNALTSAGGRPGRPCKAREMPFKSSPCRRSRAASGR